MINNQIIRILSKILFPFLIIFALYVQFHGDYGPGGGFQAGVVVAAAFVFYALVNGLAKLKEIISTSSFLVLGGAGYLGSTFVYYLLKT